MLRILLSSTLSGCTAFTFGTDDSAAACGQRLERPDAVLVQVIGSAGNQLSTEDVRVFLAGDGPATTQQVWKHGSCLAISRNLTSEVILRHDLMTPSNQTHTEGQRIATRDWLTGNSLVRAITLEPIEGQSFSTWQECGAWDNPPIAAHVVGTIQDPSGQPATGFAVEIATTPAISAENRKLPRSQLGCFHLPSDTAGFLHLMRKIDNTHMMEPADLVVKNWAPDKPILKLQFAPANSALGFFGQEGLPLGEKIRIVDDAKSYLPASNLEVFLWDSQQSSEANLHVLPISRLGFFDIPSEAPADARLVVRFRDSERTLGKVVPVAEARSLSIIKLSNLDAPDVHPACPWPWVVRAFTQPIPLQVSEENVQRLHVWSQLLRDEQVIAQWEGGAAQSLAVVSHLTAITEGNYTVHTRVGDVLTDKLPINPAEIPEARNFQCTITIDQSPPKISFVTEGNRGTSRSEGYSVFHFLPGWRISLAVNDSSATTITAAIFAGPLVDEARKRIREQIIAEEHPEHFGRVDTSMTLPLEGLWTLVAFADDAAGNRSDPEFIDVLSYGEQKIQRIRALDRAAAFEVTSTEPDLRSVKELLTLAKALPTAQERAEVEMEVWSASLLPQTQLPYRPELITTLTLDDSVYQVKFSRDNSRLFASSGSLITAWNAAGEVICQRDMERGPGTMEPNPDGTVLATLARGEFSLTSISPSGCQAIATQQLCDSGPNTSPGPHIRFKSNRWLITTGCAPRRVWLADSEGNVTTLTDAQEGILSDFHAWSPVMRSPEETPSLQVATVHDTSLRISGAPLTNPIEVILPTRTQPKKLWTTPNDRWIFTHGEKNSIAYVHIPRAVESLQDFLGPAVGEINTGDSLRVLATDPTSRWLAIGGAAGRIQLWKIEEAAASNHWAQALQWETTGRGGYLDEIHFDALGERIFVVDEEGITIRSAATGQPVAPRFFRWPDGTSPGNIVLDPQTDRLAISGFADNFITLYATKKRNIPSLSHNLRRVWSTGSFFNTEGDTLVLQDDNGCFSFWNTSDNGFGLPVLCDTPRVLKYLPDDRFIVSPNQTSLEIRTKEGAIAAHLELPNALFRMSFSRDGNTVAGIDEYTAKLCSFSSGTCRSFPLPDDYIGTNAISIDESGGRILISTSGERQASIELFTAAGQRLFSHKTDTFLGATLALDGRSALIVEADVSWTRRQLLLFRENDAWTAQPIPMAEARTYATEVQEWISFEDPRENTPLFVGRTLRALLVVDPSHPEPLRIVTLGSNVAAVRPLPGTPRILVSESSGRISLIDLRTTKVATLPGFGSPIKEIVILPRNAEFATVDEMGLVHKLPLPGPRQLELAIKQILETSIP